MADEQQGTSSPGQASSADAKATNLALTPSSDGVKHTDADHDSSGLLETEELPSPETSRKIEAYEVLDHEGKSHSFKSVFQGRDTVDRVLVIFIRHFFCGVSRLLMCPRRVLYEVVHKQKSRKRTKIHDDPELPRIYNCLISSYQAR